MAAFIHVRLKLMSPHCLKTPYRWQHNSACRATPTHHTGVAGKVALGGSAGTVVGAGALHTEARLAVCDRGRADTVGRRGALPGAASGASVGCLALVLVAHGAGAALCIAEALLQPNHVSKTSIHGSLSTKWKRSGPTLAVQQKGKGCPRPHRCTTMRTLGKRATRHSSHHNQKAWFLENGL